MSNSFYKTILYINTGERESVSLALIKDGQLISKKNYTVRSQDLQTKIVDFLAENTQLLEEINALAVCRNGESLTGTRMGIASANALAWILKLPIIELDDQDTNTDLEQLIDAPNALKTVIQTQPLA